MQTAIIRNHRLLALLLERWEVLYGKFSTDRHIRLLRLWALLPDDIDLPQLQRTLCPVFAEDTLQQKQFNNLYAELQAELTWLENIPDVVDSVTTPLQTTAHNLSSETDESRPSQIQEGVLHQPDFPPVVDHAETLSSSPELQEVLEPAPEPAPLITVAEPVPKRRPLVIAMEECINPPFSWNINPKGDTQVAIETQEGWNRTLIHLRRREPAKKPAIDLRASILATIRQPGMPAFRYRQHTRPPEYLLLVERYSQNDHRAELFEYVFQTLRANRVYVDCFYYTGDLRVCRNRKYPAGLKPSELYYKFPNARLLILGSGHRFISSRTGLLSDWTSVFKSWSMRVLLTPVPHSAWGHKESLLQHIFTLLPASVHSLQYIGNAPNISTDGYAALPGFIRNAAEIQPIELDGPLVRTLLLHYDTGMLSWIAACAVYPALHYSLTIRLGRLLSAMLGYNLVTAENLLALSRLSWFTAGKIPEEQRDELLEYLCNRYPDRHQAVLHDLQQLMEENPPPENSVAWVEHHINLAVLKVKMDQSPDESLIRELREVIKRLDSPEKRKGLLLPEKWGELLDKIMEEETTDPSLGILTEAGEELTTEQGEDLIQEDMMEQAPETVQPVQPDLSYKLKVKTEDYSTPDTKTFESYRPILAQINHYARQFQQLSNDALREKTAGFRLRVTRDGTLMDMLPEAFAVVQETCRRFRENDTLVVTATEHDRNLEGKPYITISGDKVGWKTSWIIDNIVTTWDTLPNDVQLMAAIAIHQGKIAEIAIGEGKHIAMLAAAYLNGLTGNSVFWITPDDYLTRLQFQRTSPILEFLFLSTACIDDYKPSSEARAQAYQTDIAFGSGNSFVYDYLRDNIALSAEELTQHAHHFAMIEEVDSVLIDHANAPMVLTGAVTQGAEDQEYIALNPGIRKLVDEQNKRANIFLSDAIKLYTEGKTGIQEGQAGMALLRAYRAMPNARPLIKFLSQEGVKILLQKAEHYYTQNAKLLSSVDQELLYTMDENSELVELTEQGTSYLCQFHHDPDFFTIPDIVSELDIIDNSRDMSHDEKIKFKELLSSNYALINRRIHITQQLLRAHTLFEKDSEYIVKEGAIQMIDVQTGRLSEGIQFLNGLHQALEAKENLRVSEVTQTVASITVQNYFRKYHKLAGITTVAATEAKEYWDVYKLNIVPIPPNRQLLRIIYENRVYKTVREKFNALIDEIVQIRYTGRPVLISTISVDISELLSRMLKLRGIDHKVLNARYQSQEAEILAEAGLASKVTIATNVAAWSPEIQLGPGVSEAGGLAVLGSELHQNRRLDRKLQALAGVCGHPGSSLFFISLEDNLLRLNKSERLAKLIDNMVHREGDIIQHPLVTNTLEEAQKKVEDNRLALRKRMLEYDDVMETHRSVIFTKRKKALLGELSPSDIRAAFTTVASELVETHRQNGNFDSFRIEAIRSIGIDPEMDPAWFKSAPLTTVLSFFEQQIFDLYKRKSQQIGDRLLPIIKDVFTKEGHRYKRIVIPFSDGTTNLNISAKIEDAVQTNGASVMPDVEKNTFLAMIDDAWKLHLYQLESAKENAQNAHLINRNPLESFKLEAYELFENLIRQIDAGIAGFLLKGTLTLPDEEDVKRTQQQQMQEAQRRAQANRLRTNIQSNPVSRGQEPTIGRNEPCPCGSGKKYKYCHGA